MIKLDSLEFKENFISECKLLINRSIQLKEELEAKVLELKNEEKKRKLH